MRRNMKKAVSGILFFGLACLTARAALPTDIRIGSLTVPAQPQDFRTTDIKAAADETRGILYVAYRDNNRQYHLIKSTDNGQTWSSPKAVLSRNFLNMAVDSRGIVHLVAAEAQGAIVYRNYNNGTLSTIKTISMPSGCNKQLWPRIAIDGNDNVHLLFWRLYENTYRTTYVRLKKDAGSFDAFEEWRITGSPYSGDRLIGRDGDIFTDAFTGNIGVVYGTSDWDRDPATNKVTGNTYLEHRIRSKNGSWLHHRKFKQPCFKMDQCVAGALGPGNALHMITASIPHKNNNYASYTRPEGTFYWNDAVPDGELDIRTHWGPKVSVGSVDFYLHENGDRFVSTLNVSDEPPQRAWYRTYNASTGSWSQFTYVSPTGYRNGEFRGSAMAVPCFVYYKKKVLMFFIEQAPGEPFKFYYRVVKEYNSGQTVARPVINPAAGTYYDQVKVSITCGTSGATIRYTTDGSNPTSGSTAYSAAFTLTAGTTVKARAFKSGMTASDVAGAVYVIQSASTLHIKMNAGSNTVPGWEAQNNYVSGGADYTFTPSSVNRSMALNPGPASMYMTVRHQEPAFTFGQVPDGDYTVRLHYLDGEDTDDGRKMTVKIEGTTVETGFNIAAEAGGAWIALVKEYSATVADGNGLTVVFDKATGDDAFVSGIEIIAGTQTSISNPRSQSSGTSFPFPIFNLKTGNQTIPADMFDLQGRRVDLRNARAGVYFIAGAKGAPEQCRKIIIAE